MSTATHRRIARTGILLRGFIAAAALASSATAAAAQGVSRSLERSALLQDSGAVALGEPVAADPRLETPDAPSTHAFVDPRTALAGEDGLRDAVTRGLIRPATSADLDEWMNAQRTAAAGEGAHADRDAGRGHLRNAYVVLAPFTLPAGLYGAHGATFFVPRGVQRPTGNPGHSRIYDFNTLSCVGPTCAAQRTTVTGGSAHAARSPVVGTSITPQRADGEYTLGSQVDRQQGKWYFEVEIDYAKVDSGLEAMLIAGIANQKGSVVSMHHIRAHDLFIDLGKGDGITIVGGNLGEDIRLPKFTIGIAVDLDEGKLYDRRAGEWRHGEPGSAKGMDVKLGRRYRAAVRTSVPIAKLMKDGIVNINFGARPFTEAIPQGYRAFESGVVIASPAEAASFLAPNADIAGMPAQHWLRGYWAWSRGVPQALKPATDDSGMRCAQGQSGPVWFLTGSESASPVRRTCSVPRNVYLLVPLINVLAQPSGGQPVACAQLLQALQSWGSNVAGLYLSVDGVALSAPASYRASTGCFDLNDVSAGAHGLAAGDGYWVFLPPLASGTHELRFGGKAMDDGFTQDVHYRIDVR